MSADAPICRIVPFAAGHLPMLRQVFLESRRQTFVWQPPETFQLLDLDEQIEGETILVAVHGNEPIGFVSWWPPGDFIHHLFVLPKWHGRGIGTALLEECLSNLGRPAQLKCLCLNQSALDFYCRAHWQVVARERGENGDYFLLSFDEHAILKDRSE